VRNRPLLQIGVFFLVGCAILIPIALLIPWFPTGASKQASNAKTLYDVLLIATIPIFVGVETVVLFSVWKFRMRPGEEDKDGPPIHGNTRLEVIWTTAPALNEDSQKGETLVNVTERQFAFEFSYPVANGQQVVSPVLYMAKGQPYVFHIRSLDVIHSFFVPDFSEKIDAVPGIATDLRVTPTRLGSYPAECTELCGAGHSLMRASVHVLTPAAFHAWLSSQKPNGTPPIGFPPSFAAQPGVPGASAAPSSTSTSSSSSSSAAGAPSAAAGKAVFAGSAGCSSCHTLAAAGASGTVGPNLDVRLRTDCASAASKKIRGATLAQCINTAITKPYAYLPPGYAAGVMPATFAKTLSSTQIQALVAFLSSVAK
jgi:cytochrome c oxidase subunit 2